MNIFKKILFYTVKRKQFWTKNTQFLSNKIIRLHNVLPLCSHKCALHLITCFKFISVTRSSVALFNASGYCKVASWSHWHNKRTHKELCNQESSKEIWKRWPWIWKKKSYDFWIARAILKGEEPWNTNIYPPPLIS